MIRLKECSVRAMHVLSFSERGIYILTSTAAVMYSATADNMHVVGLPASSGKPGVDITLAAELLLATPPMAKCVKLAHVLRGKKMLERHQIR